MRPKKHRIGGNASPKWRRNQIRRVCKNCRFTQETVRFCRPRAAQNRCFGPPAKWYRQFLGTGSSVLGLRLDFDAFEAPSYTVNPTFWSSGKVQERQKDPEGRLGNVPEGTKPAELLAEVAPEQNSARMRKSAYSYGKNEVLETSGTPE